MGITILLLSFLLFSFIYSKFNFESYEILIYSFFSQILLIVLLTEFLSSQYLLDKQILKISWIVIVILLILTCLVLYKGFHFRLKYKKPNLTIANSVIILLFVLLFVQAVVYPPNNYDAMTYHLARIPNWLGNNSLEHYPTNIYRQLYQPPFSSILLLNINVLSNSDAFSNTLQMLFLIISIKTIEQIGNMLGVQKRGYMLIYLCTIPSIVLQASSVTNNIIESTFVLIALLYALKTLNENKIIYFILIGVSSGLCLLTKGTAYIYIFPIFFMICIHLLLSKKFKMLKLIVLSTFLCLILNVFHYNRNYKLCSNILGTDKTESSIYSNSTMSGKLLTSNIIKNVGCHLGPYPLNKISEKYIYRIHDILGMNINQKGTNFDDFEFRITSAPNSEDNAPNFIQICLIFICIFMLIIGIVKGSLKSNLYFLFAIILMQFLIFNLYLKWQPWHSRNHTALFFEFVPLIGILIFDRIKSKWVLNIFFSVILMYALTMIVFNKLRPFISLPKITANVNMLSSRELKFYADNIGTSKDFNKIYEIIGNNKNQFVALNIYWNEYEYPFFNKCYSNEIYPHHILIDNNLSKNIKRNEVEFDFIISKRIYLDEILYNNRTYYNVTRSNKTIALFRGK